MNKNIYLVTYPRCGSSYLFWLFASAFDKETANDKAEIFKSHTINDAKINYLKENNYIISVLRDPIESISSIVAMEYFYFNNNNILDKTINSIVKNKITSYEYFFNNIINFSNILLNYEDINIYRDRIIEYISNETGNKIIKKEYIDKIRDIPEYAFLKSSKTYEKYNYIKNIVLNNNLEGCYKIYNKLYNSCLDLK